MEQAIQSAASVLLRGGPAEDASVLFSTESVLNLQRLIFAGSPFSEVLATIAKLVESQTKGMLCTIWLSDEEGSQLPCAAAPVFLDSAATWGPWQFAQKGHPAAQRSIKGSRYM
jgi:formate hydrogenlyase transcriptional activator